MALGDPIDIEVTVSGESNTISSFQGGTTTVENYSGGNAIDVTLSDATSATTATSGHNVDVTFSGNSTSVTGPFFLASQSSEEKSVKIWRVQNFKNLTEAKVIQSYYKQ